MPRSWPSTDAEPAGRRVDLVDKAADRPSGAPSVEIEVVDLDPGSVPIASPSFRPQQAGMAHVDCDRSDRSGGARLASGTDRSRTFEHHLGPGFARTGNGDDQHEPGSRRRKP